MSLKQTIDDLAIFGGSPVFATPLHVGRPNIGSRDAFLKRMADVFDRGWLTNNGPLVQQFEQQLCDYLGVGNAIALCNATVALEIAVRALGMRGEVIVPSFTFVATAHALRWQCVTPVFCDVDPATHNLDPARVEALITPRTSGILGVHVWGQPCAVDDLTEIAERHDLALLYDAAHAFGCSHNGKMIGNFGRAEVFSFHATKFFNTFEGGAITTNDDELAARIRLMKNFGFAGYDQVVHLGTNGKMSEASAAMGLTSFDSLEAFVCINQRNHARYRAGLRGVDGVRLLDYNSAENHNHQYIVVEVDEAVAGLSRDQLVALLHAEQVLARRYFYPGVHQMEPYRTEQPLAEAWLPHTTDLSQRVMVLPTGSAVDPDQIDTLCALIRFAVHHNHEISRRLTEATIAHSLHRSLIKHHH